MERNPPEDVVQHLESLANDTDNPKVVLEFIGEAWVNDYARAVDDGRCEYRVPLDDLQNDDGDWRIHSTATNYHVDDGLRQHENAPDWVREWRGPFTIKLANFDPL